MAAEIKKYIINDLIGNRPTSDWRCDRNDIKSKEREAYNAPGHTRSRALGKGSEQSDETLNTGDSTGGLRQ